MHLLHECHRCDAVFSLCRIRWCMILICSVAGNVHFVRLIKGVPASVFHCECTVLFFVINNDFVGTYYDSINILFLIKLPIYHLFIYICRELWFPFIEWLCPVEAVVRDSRVGSRETRVIIVLFLFFLIRLWQRLLLPCGFTFCGTRALLQLTLPGF